MIMSFKLEADPDILVHKVQYSLDRYQHHIVIGNLLSTRKWEVVFVAPGQADRWIRVPRHQRKRTISEHEVRSVVLDRTVGDRPIAPKALPDGDAEVEIESLIIPAVEKMHTQHIATAAKKDS